MSVRVIIGDYTVNKETDLIISNWNPDVVRKTKLKHNKTIVLYAESLGLTKTDFEFISKNSTADVIIVCETRKSMNGVRKNKNMKITYSEGYCEEVNPFDIAKMILVMNDRDYVYEFLKTNKCQLYIIIKALVSASPDCKINSNLGSIAWLDQNLYRVNPDILYAYCAYKIKPERYIRFIKWRYPKKSEGEK